jgi:hypothetical protein
MSRNGTQKRLDEDQKHIVDELEIQLDLAVRDLFKSYDFPYTEQGAANTALTIIGWLEERVSEKRTGR